MTTTLVHSSLTLFSPTELHAMVLGGEILRHGILGFPIYLPVGSSPTAVDRAASLVTLMRPGRVITGKSARWIHIGGPTPEWVELSRRSGRSLESLGVHCRYRRLKHRDVMAIADLVLTTPERTALDLRREGHHEDAALLDALIKQRAQEAGT